jgi:hypothetical protein
MPAEIEGTPFVALSPVMLAAKHVLEVASDGCNLQILIQAVWPDGHRPGWQEFEGLLLDREPIADYSADQVNLVGSMNCITGHGILEFE